MLSHISCEIVFREIAFFQKRSPFEELARELVSNGKRRS